MSRCQGTEVKLRRVYASTLIHPRRLSTTSNVCRSPSDDIKMLLANCSGFGDGNSSQTPSSSLNDARSPTPAPTKQLEASDDSDVALATERSLSSDQEVRAQAVGSEKGPLPPLFPRPYHPRLVSSSTRSRLQRKSHRAPRSCFHPLSVSPESPILFPILFPTLFPQSDASLQHRTRTRTRDARRVHPEDRVPAGS